MRMLLRAAAPAKQAAGGETTFPGSHRSLFHWLLGEGWFRLPGNHMQEVLTDEELYRKWPIDDHKPTKLAEES